MKLSLDAAADLVHGRVHDVPTGSGMDGMRDVFSRADFDPGEAMAALKGLLGCVPSPLTPDQHVAMLVALQLALLAGYEVGKSEGAGITGSRDHGIGRLFTDADVRKLGARLLGNREVGPDLLAEALSDLDSEFTFPAGEPVFVLRASDSCAPDALSGGPICYEDECTLAHASDSHTEAVRAAADEMRRWQREHPDRVKVPG